MKEKGSVSVYFVQSALEPVKAKGLDVEALLSECGIPSGLILSENSRVTAQHFADLWLAVARVLDDELFGQDSRRMKVGSFAMLCQILIDCGTLKDAVLRMARFFNLILDDFHCSLELRGPHACLVIRDKLACSNPRVLGYETLLMLQHGVICWLIGRRIPILSASFAYEEPSRSAEYKFMYCEQLTFNAEQTSLTFDAEFLNRNVIQNERTLKEFIRVAPANIVLKYKNHSGISAQIKRRLRSASNGQWPEFEEIASSLNMTTSTLHRRLESEGETFQSIKNNVRRDLAIQYLSHTNKKISEISDELGFAEPSAFQHAFKKWTGTRPGEYRRNTGTVEH
jgi:AraC-like DNA-binding protein